MKDQNQKFGMSPMNFNDLCRGIIKTNDFHDLNMKDQNQRIRNATYEF